MDTSTLVAALTGSSIFVTLLPPLAEVRRASTDSATARDVHAGVAMASAALVGAGLVIAFAEGDHKPVLICLALAGLMGGIYELTLHQYGGEEGPNAAAVHGPSWR